jgi:MFS family permease
MTMESIITSLKDPAWWFTVFLVGIIVSIAAGFLKDWIGRLFSKYSTKFREHRKAKALRREELYEALATNDVFLILSLIRLMGIVTISTVLLLVYLALPAILELKEILCTVAPSAGKCTQAINPLAERTIIAIIGALTMFMNYTASSRFGLVMKGFNRYRKRHALPRVM